MRYNSHLRCLQYLKEISHFVRYATTEQRTFFEQAESPEKAQRDQNDQIYYFDIEASYNQVRNYDTPTYQFSECTVETITSRNKKPMSHHELKHLLSVARNTI